MPRTKIALVTGASAGMGKDFAKALLKEGMTVYAVARRIEKMDDLKELGIIPLKMDITKEEDVQYVVDQIKQDHGHIDVLINNAGFGMFGSVEETTLADARYQFEVNLFGLASLTQKIIPLMRGQKSGKIINISSVGGKIYSPMGAWYQGTKHALEGWSDCLRLELSSFGIDVVVIEPGAIVTEFGDVMTGPMIERSGHGPYASIVNALVKAMEKEYKAGSSSAVNVITKLVLKAVRSKKPKTRYAGGKYAFTLLFIRKWFGDRIYDRAIMSILN